MEIYVQFWHQFSWPKIYCPNKFTGKKFFFTFHLSLRNALKNYANFLEQVFGETLYQCWKKPVNLSNLGKQTQNTVIEKLVNWFHFLFIALSIIKSPVSFQILKWNNSLVDHTHSLLFDLTAYEPNWLEEFVKTFFFDKVEFSHMFIWIKTQLLDWKPCSLLLGMLMMSTYFELVYKESLSWA